MIRILLLTIIFISAIGIPTHGTAQTAIGKADQVKTSVRGRGSRSIERNSEIFQNERIRTNRTGLGHFRFTDGTKMVVGPRSNMVLDELVFNPNRSTFNRIVLRSSSGATRIISGRSRSSAYRIETPVGVMGLRGTAFDIRHYRGRTYVMVLAGRVQVCNRRNRCQNLTRKCSYVVVNRLGRVSSPVLPRQGNFSARDMARFFPFVENERQLRRDYRLNTSRCRGGGIVRDRARSRFIIESDPGSEPAMRANNDPTNGDDTVTPTPTIPTIFSDPPASTPDTPSVFTPVTTPVDVPFPAPEPDPQPDPTTPDPTPPAVVEEADVEVAR